MWGARAEQGPAAVPGEYQVRITANGQTESQPLEVKLDPREHTTQAQMEEQFKLASQVRDEVSEADDMVLKIRHINEEAKKRTEKASDSALVSASNNLRDRLSTIEEEIYQVRNRANEDPLNFPIKLNNQIAALARVIETGDYAPTAQDYEVFKILTARLQTVQSTFDETLKTDLAHLNQLLTAHNLTEIDANEGSEHAISEGGQQK